MKNVVLSNIECKDGTQMLEDLRNINDETK